ncbi:MAG: N-formylglutamate deformylase [Dongiaceae bacterium]
MKGLVPTRLRPKSVEIYRFTQGSGPLLVSMPHVGTHLPDALAARMTSIARTVPDTDWHVDRLYNFLGDLGASVLAATHSRYVIDLNRPPDDTTLYPGASNTGLCPTSRFDEGAVYEAGNDPDAAEMERRRAQYWQPYHDAIAAALDTIHADHGYALLFEAHSIRSVVPRFFEGRLPDINLGTGGGTSTDPELAARLVEQAGDAIDYTSVLNGRFKGGYITRHYGNPAAHVHAVQLELAQITYMNEDPPFDFDEPIANRVRPVLRRIVETMLNWGPERYGR